jgi:hypothetical protein
MKHIFIADDGTEFDNEKECLEYETTYGEMMQSFILLDKSFKKIDVTSPFYVDDVAYLWILDGNNAESVCSYLDEQYGLADGIHGYGMYIMRKDELVWDSIDELITYHEDELTRLNEAKEHIVEKYNK